MQKGFSVYIHLPFCVHKCPYCDFNSYALDPFLSTKNSSFSDLESRYVEALIREISTVAAEPYWQKRECDTVFFGGGTPSLFTAKSIARILVALRDNFTLQKNCEITLEANPGTIREQLAVEKLRAFRLVGVNRLSMGAQSFLPEKLKSLGRIHSVEDSHSAISNIQAAGFTNFNLDLMYGVKGETLDDLISDLSTLVSHGSPHISAYCLTIEPGTNFGRRTAKGEVLTVDEDLHAEMYCRVQEFLESHGVLQYEISNFAKPDYECRHNLAYWNRNEYLGFGAGAHSFSYTSAESLSATRSANIPGPVQYIKRVAEAGRASQLTEDLSVGQLKLEFFFLGLRRRMGVSRGEYQELFHTSLDEDLKNLLPELAAQNLLSNQSDALQLSPRGFLFSNTVFEKIGAALL